MATAPSRRRRAALRGGASVLAVATAGEAGELRRAGITAPILVLGAISDEELPVAVAAGAELTVWEPDFVEHVRLLAAQASRADRGARQARHRPRAPGHA